MSNKGKYKTLSGKCTDSNKQVISVWDGDEQFIFIGISQLQKSLYRRNPLSRMQSHAGGRRSGDQFCIYIHDIFIILKLIKTGDYKSERDRLDKVTRQFIHDNLRYRFVSFLSDDRDVIIRKLENKIKKGDMGLTPKNNEIDVRLSTNLDYRTTLSLFSFLQSVLSSSSRKYNRFQRKSFFPVSTC